jgi:hypothetical protein
MIMARRNAQTDAPSEATEEAASESTAAATARPPLDLSVIQVRTGLNRSEMAQKRRTRVTRTPEQKAIDAIVEAAWKQWVEEGKPASWVEQPGREITAPAEQWDTVTYYVHKAGKFYDLKIRFGDVERFTAEDGTEYASAVFTATERAAGDKPDATLPEDGAEDGEEQSGQDEPEVNFDADPEPEAVTEF